jgi:hypothetical protein
LVLNSTEPEDASPSGLEEANREMAGLSSNGSYREIEGATHFSLVYRQDDARLCAAQILEVLDAVRQEQDLTRITE